MGELRDIIETSNRVVFFGGAGVSTESGIPDFRSADGLYSRETGETYPAEVVLSRSFFDAHPAEFFDFYRSALLYPDAQPNPAHLALASLERAGTLSAVITQNIDGLHSLAGSRRVLELHGNVNRNFCMECGKQFGVSAIASSAGVPRCPECGGVIKPDVVLYEEALDGATLDAAVGELAAGDTLIVGGTSLAVYPAAGLLGAFRGDNLVLIDRDVTELDSLATLAIHEPIGATLAEFV